MGRRSEMEPDVKIGYQCMKSGMGWYRMIRLIKEAITNIEKGYKVTAGEKEQIDVEFELKNIKRMLFTMVHELGVLTTCGLPSGGALSKREIVINATDNLAKKDYTALRSNLEILEKMY